MKGRQENENKIIKRIEGMISSSPRYMKGYYYSLNDKSYMTKYTYIQYVLDFINFAENELNVNIRDARCFSKVKASDINCYMAQLNGKNSIKASRLYGIKTFFNYLIADEYINNNPCDRVAAPKDKEEHQITSLTKNEIDIIKNNILTNCGNSRTKQSWIKRDYAIVMLGLSLGLRVTSLSEIDIDDIDFDSKEIKIVEKGNKTRFVKFSDNIANVLLDWIKHRDRIIKNSNKECNALFISNQIKRINARSIENMVAKYTYNIDKHITPHKLRSTCATNVYNKTGDIYLTANILGHNQINTTRRYAAISDERKQKAATAMDSILF